MTALESLRAPEWDAMRSIVVLLPTGSTEQHGPHLPMGTDTEIAAAICSLAAAGSSDLVVAPAIPYGVSDHHRSLPGGAVTAGPDAFSQYMAEVVLSLADSARRRGVLVVNGHGGNRPAIGFMIDRLGSARGEQPIASCSWWDLVPELIEGADSHVGSSQVGHAGAIETSVMLALEAPVRAEDLPQPDAPPAVGRAVRWLDFARRFPSGVIGAPRAGDADHGKALLDAAALRLADLAHELAEDWWGPVG